MLSSIEGFSSIASKSRYSSKEPQKQQQQSFSVTHKKPKSAEKQYAEILTKEEQNWKKLEELIKIGQHA